MIYTVRQHAGHRKKPQLGWGLGHVLDGGRGAPVLTHLMFHAVFPALVPTNMDRVLFVTRGAHHLPPFFGGVEGGVGRVSRTVSRGLLFASRWVTYWPVTALRKLALPPDDLDAIQSPVGPDLEMGVIAQL